MVADVCDFQAPAMLRITFHEPAEAVLNADDFGPIIASLDGHGANNPVDARGRAAAHQQGQPPIRRYTAHCILTIPEFPAALSGLKTDSVILEGQTHFVENARRPFR